MPVPARLIRSCLAALLAVGCGAEEAPQLARPTVDTLPGGAVHVSSPGPTGWADTSGWKLVETVRVGGGDTVVFTEPGALALDEAGRMYVADRSPAVIKVFDREGRFVRSIGREGGGPGEFRVAFIAVHGSNLVVHDPQQSRTTVFDTSGTFLRSWASLCCYWTPIVVDQAGLLYLAGPSAPDSGRMYIRYRLDGTAVDTLFHWPDPPGKLWEFGNSQMQMMMPVALSPETHIGYPPAGGFVTGRSEAFRAVVTRTGRDTVRVFERAWTPPAVTDAWRQRLADSVVRSLSRSIGEDAAREQVKVGDIPSIAPAFESIHVDGEGNYWFRVFSSDTTISPFEVFDPEGAYLGSVHGPAGLSSWRMVFGKGVLLAAMEDGEGMPLVVRLEIRKP